MNNTMVCLNSQFFRIGKNIVPPFIRFLSPINGCFQLFNSIMGHRVRVSKIIRPMHNFNDLLIALYNYTKIILDELMYFDLSQIDSLFFSIFAILNHPRKTFKITMLFFFSFFFLFFFLLAIVLEFDLCTSEGTSPSSFICAQAVSVESKQMAEQSNVQFYRHVIKHR